MLFCKPKFSGKHYYAKQPQRGYSGFQVTGTIKGFFWEG